MASDPYRYFRLEARELLDDCAKTLIELEKGGAVVPLVQRLLRFVHTLKGAARVVKQAAIADQAHAIEDALAPFRDAEQPLPRLTIATLLERFEAIGGGLRILGQAEPVATVIDPRSINPPVEEALHGIRADIQEMDAVLDGVAETHAQLTGLRHATGGLEKVQRLADLLLAQLAPGRRLGGVPERLFAIADELRHKLGSVERGFVTAADRMDRELQQLRDAAERLRLVPVESLFTRLERTALDTAGALGKKIVFTAEGGETRLDSQVLAALQGALVQLVRNAVAHGIELPQERVRAGKAEIGRITVRVSRRGRRVIFACRDDGGGLDLDAVRRSAIRRGAISAQAAPADADALIRLLLQGGITTSKGVTELAGRGIGLDIVRDAVERLGGDISVKTVRGQGSIFELVVPPSLAALEALMVVAGNGEVVAIPLDAIRATARIAAAEIVPSAPGLAVLYDRQAIAFIPLSAVLGGERQTIRRHWSAVILSGAGGLAALGVDQLLGTAKIVIRPLPEQLSASPAIAGLMLDAAGNPQLVLDADGVIAAAQAGGSAHAQPVADRLPVLVIDDSLTTRMLEQSILESAGYDVDVALSAEEGLEMVRRKRYALILVDVEMPGMDGFAFVAQIRADPALYEIPAILVTSRSAPEDLDRGRAVGAQGYIVKSEFDQSALLALIAPLVG